MSVCESALKVHILLCVFFLSIYLSICTSLYIYNHFIFISYFIIIGDGGVVSSPG